VPDRHEQYYRKRPRRAAATCPPRLEILAICQNATVLINKVSDLSGKTTRLPVLSYVRTHPHFLLKERLHAENPS
jgi:hypothetical protein